MVNCTAITSVSKHNLQIAKQTPTHCAKWLWWSICLCINQCFKSVWTFQKHEKADKIGIKTMSFSIKFEHKKTKSTYNVNFPFNPFHLLLELRITLLRMRTINLEKLFHNFDRNWPKNWIYTRSSRSPKRKKNQKIFS